MTIIYYVPNDVNYYINKQEPRETREPAHHARRPMNAFLIFCKRHRGSVRSGFPHLENRAVTRVLGEWWATLHPDQKRSYTNLAQEVSAIAFEKLISYLLCRILKGHLLGIKCCSFKFSVVSSFTYKQHIVLYITFAYNCIT